MPLLDGTILFVQIIVLSYGRRCEKACLRGFMNTKGADQPAHLGSLISAFVNANWKVSYLDLLRARFSSVTAQISINCLDQLKR